METKFMSSREVSTHAMDRLRVILNNTTKGEMCSLINRANGIYGMNGSESLERNPGKFQSVTTEILARAGIFLNDCEKSDRNAIMTKIHTYLQWVAGEISKFNIQKARLAELEIQMSADSKQLEKLLAGN